MELTEGTIERCSDIENKTDDRRKWNKPDYTSLTEELEERLLVSHEEPIGPNSKVTVS